MTIEEEGRLSPAEERFERARRRVGRWAAPLAFAVLWAAPLPLPAPAHRLAAILAAVVIAWITEALPLPVTALLGPAACVLAGLGSAEAVFKEFSHPVIMLFLGSFLLAEAFQRHGLDRRLALLVLSRPWAAATPRRLLVSVGALSAGLSMWMSNSAVTAMLLPLASGLLAALGEGRRSRYAAGVMLMVAYGASIGGLATPVGTPPNLIGIALIEQQTGRHLSFLAWMSFALPLSLVALVVATALLWRLHGDHANRPLALAGALSAERRAQGPWSRAERHTAAAFCLALLGWVGPGVLDLALGSAHPAAAWARLHAPEGIVALLAAGLLFLLPGPPDEEGAVLSWRDAARIDWGTLLLFGGGLSLGQLMASTGLARALGDGLAGVVAVRSVWGLTAGGVALGIVVSELTSNTAAANMVIPLMIAMAGGLGVDPVPPALGACLGSSFGFMLPISTPPNAIVYGTGHVRIGQMARAGILLDLLGGLAVFLTLRLLLPLLGLARG